MRISMKVIFYATISVILLLSSINCQQTPKHLTLTIECPQRIFLHKLATCTINVTNNGDAPVKDLVLRAQIPACLQYGKRTEEEATILRFNIGEIKPKESKKLAFEVRARKTGECVNEAQLFLGERGSKPILKATAIINIMELPALAISIYDTDDPVEVGKNTIYVTEVRNEGSAPVTGIQLSCSFSSEMQFVAGAGPNVSFKLEKSKVTFDTVSKLEPGKKLTYKVTCRAIKPGSARFSSTLQYAQFPKQIISEEETKIYK